VGPLRGPGPRPRRDGPPCFHVPSITDDLTFYYTAETRYSLACTLDMLERMCYSSGMAKRSYETEIGRAMQQLARAVYYREAERGRWDHANAQVEKWAAKACEAGMPLRRIATYLDLSHTSARRAIERHYARTLER